MSKLKNNAAVEHSLLHGEDQGDYIGLPPGYLPDKVCEVTGKVLSYKKVTAGIPFVKKERAND